MHFYTTIMYFLLYALSFMIIMLVLMFLYTYFYLMDEPCLKTIYRTFRRDLRALILYSKIYLFIKYCHIRNLTAVDYFNSIVQRNPNRICFAFEDEEWTFKQVDELSNKIAHSFIEQGYQKGDEVALLMENCPDYICIWLGLAKIGVITALINTNSIGDTLAHSLNIIDMKGFIFGQSFAETVEKAIPYILKLNTAKFYSYARQSEKKLVLPFHCKYLHTLLTDTPSVPLDQRNFKINFEDKLLYMYTSGTTGLPKAAVITHRKYINATGAVKYGMKSDESHIFYNALPLYHITGGFLYIVFVLVFGHKMVLRRKFSASEFWKEILQHNVTVFLYIGEMCRYLLNQPEMPEETQHSLQMFIGSGLKHYLWKNLQQRFRIKKIVDIYGSTEGNIIIVNYFDKVGAVGIISRIFFRIQGMYLVKVDQGTGEVIRDPKGLCIRCKPGEPGQLVGEISASNPLKIFEGYRNTEATKTKILKNCFAKGDVAFLTGDILVMDEDGYLYFEERLGDTYRWKGENVSSAEVESILSKILNCAPCIVYGVKIPDNEGRVGMATVQVKDFENIDLKKLHKDITKKLPSYAVPAFIRFSSHMEKTGTHKLIKGKFKEQGYNPEEVNDPLCVLDCLKKTYVPLTRDLYSIIMKGAMKF